MLRIKARKGYWYVSGTMLGTKVLKSTKLAAEPRFRKAAESIRLLMEHEMATGVHTLPISPSRTVYDAIELYLRNHSRLEQRDQDAFDSLGRKLGTLELRRLTSEQVQSWMQSHFKAANGTTLRRRMKPIVGMLNHEHRTGSLPGKIVLMYPKSKPYVADLIPRDRVKDVLAIRKWPLGLIVRLMLLTGARLTEVMELEWPEINLEDGLVTYRSLKGGDGVRARTVPLPDSLVTELSSVPTKIGRVIRNAYGRPYHKDWWRQQIGNIWREVREDMGLPPVPIRNLRNTYATILHEKGVDSRSIMELLGHTNLPRTFGYTAVSVERLKEIMKVMT